MKKSLGFGLLAVGVVVLGLWARADHARRIEHMITDQASAVMATSVHGATAMVSGRDIHVSGIVDGPQERDALLAALDALPGRRVITEDVTVLEVVSPFGLTVSKAPDGGLTATGQVATEALREELAAALGDAAAGLTLAAGAPAGWGDLARAGLAAFAPLNHGQMTLTDAALTLTGEALGPDAAAAAQAALAALPAGAATVDLTLLDDGTPPAFTLAYAAADGAALSGKLPPGLDAAAMAAAVGLPTITSTATQALLGPSQDASLFAGLEGNLAQVETLVLTVTPDTRSVEATVQAGVDRSAVQAGLSAALAGFKVEVTQVAASGENGARRVNAATGAQQRLMGGFWLDLPQFDVSKAGCQAQADAVLAGATINFVSGSDALDADAVAVINALAAVMVRCAEEAGLKAQIGGHTDASGVALDNLGLSQRRAVAVRRELIARGVPAAALRAQGFGDSQPIADNATEEGRALNRRTTIVWSE